MFREGALQTYTEIHRRGQPQPSQHDYEPEIHRGIRNPEVILLPHPGEDVPAGRRLVYLMKETDPNACYMKIQGKEPRELGWGWGLVETAVYCPRVRDHNLIEEDGLYYFQMPSIENPDYVAIKMLSNRKVYERLDQGCRENPYMEIHRMQQLGDNIHVLACIEALEDDDYLYIITPWCLDGDLFHRIPWASPYNARPGYGENEAKELFRQILELLRYLEQHGICHHDISPGNLMFYNGRLLLADFAMSLKFPKDDLNQRFLITPPSEPYGTPSYQAPEVFSCMPYDGVFADLWSAGVLLFNILTGYRLYEMPHPVNLKFRYYLMAEALSQSTTDSDLLMELRQDPEFTQEFYVPLQLLTNETKELLQNLLKVSPYKRWNLGQAMNSAWVRRAQVNVKRVKF